MKEYNFAYRATYLMTFRRDSLSVYEETKKTYLSFNDSLSVFRSADKMAKDSARYQLLFGKTKPTGARISIMGQSQEDNLIVKEGNTITMFEKLSIVQENDVSFFYEESKTDQLWEVTDDTLTIHDYLCQKAILTYGNRVWSAWFTPEIPISDGPYKFAGLPGLIIRIEDQTNSWKFELLELSKYAHSVTINFDRSIKYKKIQKQEFYKQKKHLLDNIVDLRTSSNVGYHNDPRVINMRKSVENVRRKDNNWIELYP